MEKFEESVSYFSKEEIDTETIIYFRWKSKQKEVYLSCDLLK